MPAPLQSESFILASASAARRAMLEHAGLHVTVDAADVDETALKNMARAAAARIEETALSLAHAKATRVAARHPGQLVLGADQMLECGTRWLDKAASLDEAAAQLAFLSGKTHRLVTAAVLMQDSEILWSHAANASLTMRPLSPGFIEAYLAAMGDEALRGVGCYAIEGLGAQLFRAVEGDHFVIMGLPLLALLEELRARGRVLA